MTGLVSAGVVVTVGSQSSAAFPIAVQAPRITAVALHQLVGLSPQEEAADQCFSDVGGNPATHIVELIGESFGSDRAHVTVNFTVLVTVPTAANVTITCRLCYLDHTKARCPVPTEVGLRTAAVSLTLAGRTSVAQYRFADIMKPPVVLGATPLVMPTTGGARYLRLTGTELKDRGTVTLTNAAGMSLECRVPVPGAVGGAGPDDAVQWLPDGSLVVCEVPEGVGSGWYINVVARSVPNDKPFDRPFSFGAPAVALVTPAALPTQGNVSVTFEGSNFGAPFLWPSNASVAVYSLSSSEPQPCVILAWNHSTIQCTAPEGVLSPAVVNITVANQTLLAPLLRYRPPAFSYFGSQPKGEFSPCESQGGCTISFQGVDLGPDDKLSVFLQHANTSERLVCKAPRARGHEFGRCEVPPGGGVGWRVVLFNGGSYSSVNGTLVQPTPTFSYLPPAVESYEVVPYSAPSNSSGSLLGLHAPVTGDFRVVLTGRSLTTLPEITIGGLPCRLRSASHTKARVGDRIPRLFVSLLHSFMLQR